MQGPRSRIVVAISKRIWATDEACAVSQPEYFFLKWTLSWKSLLLKFLQGGGGGGSGDGDDDDDDDDKDDDDDDDV